LQPLWRIAKTKINQKKNVKMEKIVYNEPSDYLIRFERVCAINFFVTKFKNTEYFDEDTD